uniref:hypothetical protein n=1 Tax=Altererythrobacter segetis TaxID=1104773 RepID=UPI00140AB36B|nr:hypothetical protein [Altererythrobacter segetis]
MATSATPRAWSVAALATRRHYFPALFVLLFALSLAAFWDNLVTDVHQPSNGDPKMLVHAFFAASWMLTLVVQSAFIRAGNVRLHRRLGTAGFIAAVGVTLSTLYLFVAKWKGWALMEPEVKANRLLLPAFAIFILLAYRNRRRPEIHKRLVLAGTLFLLEPILARLYDPYLVPVLPDAVNRWDAVAYLVYLAGTWSAFYLSLFVYDWLVLRRIHPVSLTGFAMAIALNALAYLG